MKIQLLLDAEIEKSGEGTFKSREDVAQALINEFQDPGSLDVDGSNYDVQAFEVTEHDADAVAALRIKYYCALKELHDSLGQPHTAESLAKLRKRAAKALGIKEPKPTEGGA